MKLFIPSFRRRAKHPTFQQLYQVVGNAIRGAGAQSLGDSL
jgi:hypothetical protein